MKIYEDPNHSIVLSRRGGTAEYFDTDRIQTNDAQTKSGVIDMFVDHLLDSRKPFISGESVLWAMRAVFVALESSDKAAPCGLMNEKAAADHVCRLPGLYSSPGRFTCGHTNSGTR